MAIEVFCDTYFSVRTCVSAGVPYFCAKDVSEALGYANPRQAVIHNVFEEDRLTLKNIRESTGVTPSKNEQGQSVYITEAGVYALIFGSQKEEAKAFKKFVCQTILPRLRKSYAEQRTAPLCLRNESDLHYKIIHFIRKFFPQALMAASLGELQDTPAKRIDSWRKGYQAGTPDILILSHHAKYNGFAIELKSPTGKGILSEKQDACLQQYKQAKFKTLVSDEYDVVLLEIVEYMRDVRICCPHCCKCFKKEQTLTEHLKYFHRIN